MFCNMLSFIILALLTVTTSFHVSNGRASTHRSLQMGLFDGLFGKKKTASASHILVRNVKDNDAEIFLSKLKVELNKSKNIPSAFAEAAAKHSSCPSAQKGGYLGNFSQGQMVANFDKVVFNEEIGVIHGPVKTPFGAHLILIDSRSE